MKYLIFSDIHSNLEAFQKLLSINKNKNIDKYIFLGDLVGYGPNPDEITNLYRELDNTHSIRGNHDKVIADLESSSLFNPVAAFSAEWSKTQISEDNFKYIKELSKGPEIIDHFITICHGSTFDEDYYVFSMFDALESFKFMETSDSNTRYLINPGSIGQPRDKNPNSSYILFDSRKKEINFVRFSYNVKKTQKKIQDAGLPETLATRLESGI